MRMTDRPINRAQDDASGEAARLGARVARLVGRQQELLRALQRLSRDQGALIDAGDAEALLRLLSERQTLVDEIVGIGEELAPFTARIETVLGAMSAEARRDLATRLADVEAITADVAERDQRDRTALEARRNSLIDDLSSITRSRGAVAAYDAPSAAPRFQDMEG